MEMIEGEYFLKDAHEMATGFLLKPDKKFQFVFSYGALDRYGSGSWALSGEKIILNSETPAQDPFEFVSSNRQKHSFITVILDQANEMMARYTHVSLANGIEGSWKQMDQSGLVQFQPQIVEAISLLFEFCPEKIYHYKAEASGNNEFVFRFSPTIMEVYFNDFSLTTNQDGLQGKHPLLEGDSFEYCR